VRVKEGEGKERKIRTRKKGNEDGPQENLWV